MRGCPVQGQHRCPGEGLQVCLTPPFPQTAPHKHSQAGPPSMAQGAALSCPRHAAWPLGNAPQWVGSFWGRK